MEKATKHNMAGRNTEKRVPNAKKVNQKIVMGNIKERERPTNEFAELKKEVGKLSHNLYKTELDLSKANEKLEQYQDKNTKLTQANKILCGEKADLEKQCQMVSGQCRRLNAEVDSLKEQTNKLTRELQKSQEKALQFKSLSKELKEKEIQAKEKACCDVRTQSKKVREELKGHRESEISKRQNKETMLRCEELQKDKEALQSANREMQQDLEKKETQIKLLKKEKASLNVSLSELQNYSIAARAEIRAYFAFKELKTKYSDLKEKNTEQERELETAQSKISSLKEQISEMKTSCRVNSVEDNAPLKNQIAKLESEIEQYQNMHSTSENKISLLSKRVNGLESLLSQAETEIDELKTKIKDDLFQNVSKITGLQNRIGEQSLEINRLCKKSEEWRLRCQVLQKSNSELQKIIIACNQNITACNQQLGKERENFESLTRIYKNSVAMCDDLKVQLKNAHRKYSFKETDLMETIKELRIENNVFSELSAEREKLIEDQQKQLEQMKKISDGKKKTSQSPLSTSCFSGSK